MEVAITHEITYHYSQPVYLEPQIIYMTPRWSHHLDIRNYRLDILPKPSLLSFNMDAEGNRQHIAHFAELTGRLTVKCRFDARSQESNPFEFVVYPFEAQTVPLHYPENISEFIQPYLQVSGNPDFLKDYGSRVLTPDNSSLLYFISHLAKAISAGFDYEYREEGAAMHPEELLSIKRGTCRDFSNLFMQTCRCFGIASRFVSGYFHGDPDQSRNLHGWAEVFIPGGGWRGVDPTQGVMADHRYIVLAASAHTANVAPVSGNFRGDAGAVMNAVLTMEDVTDS